MTLQESIQQIIEDDLNKDHDVAVKATERIMKLIEDEYNN